MYTVTFFQGQNEIKFNLTSETNINTLIGNFYERVNLFKKANAKLFNFSKPVLLRVETTVLNVETKEEETINIINTNLAFEALQMKCKLTWTKKGRNRFKNNVSVCIEASQMETRTFNAEDYETLNEKLG